MASVVVPSGSCGCGGKKCNCECNGPPKPDVESDSDDINFPESEDVSSDDDDDYKDDDEKEDLVVDCFGRPEMTKKQHRIYSRQIRRSGGFHVDKFPTSKLLGCIQPVELEYRYEDLKEYTELAIEYYNKKLNANLEFVDVVKANSQVVRGRRYFITFVAKDSSGETKNYQALVWDGIWEKVVQLCRPEPLKQGDPKKSRLNDSQ